MAVETAEIEMTGLVVVKTEVGLKETIARNLILGDALRTRVGSKAEIEEVAEVVEEDSETITKEEEVEEGSVKIEVR